MQRLSRVRIGPLWGLFAPVALGWIVFGLWEAPAAAQPGTAFPIGAAQPDAPRRTAYGYFPTRWRQWPCDARVDQHFPTSVGREHVPLPAGEPLHPGTFRRELPMPRGLQQPGGMTVPREPSGGLLPGGLLPGGLPGGAGPSVPGGGLELPAEPQLPDTTQPAESLLPGLPGGALPGEPDKEGPLTPESLLPGEPLPGGAGAQPQPAVPRVEPLLPGVPLEPDAGASSLMRRPAAPASGTGARVAESARTAIHQPPLRAGLQRRSPIYRPPVFGPPERTQQTARVTAQTSAERSTQAGTIQADWETAVRTSERSHHSGLAGRYGSPSMAWHRADPIPSREPDGRPAAPRSRAEQQSYVRQQSPLRQQSYAEVPEQAAEDVQPATFESGLPTALDGHCPVELVKNERWVRGDPRWAVDYQGHRYLMSSAVQRESFLVNPERYVPAYEGNDPVLVVDRGQRTRGDTRYCATYNGRLYMFSSPATLAQFRQQPERYTLEP